MCNYHVLNACALVHEGNADPLVTFRQLTNHPCGSREAYELSGSGDAPGDPIIILSQ